MLFNRKHSNFCNFSPLLFKRNVYSSLEWLSPLQLNSSSIVLSYADTKANYICIRREEVSAFQQNTIKLCIYLFIWSEWEFNEAMLKSFIRISVKKVSVSPLKARRRYAFYWTSIWTMDYSRLSWKIVRLRNNDWIQLYSYVTLRALYRQYCWWVCMCEFC